MLKVIHILVGRSNLYFSMSKTLSVALVMNVSLMRDDHTEANFKKGR